MGDSEKVQQVIDRAVSEVLESVLPELRSRLAARIREELEAVAPAASSSSSVAAPTSDLLFTAVASIQDAATQADILGALLESTAGFSGRSALIVLKRDTARVWRARGFDGDAARDLEVDPAQPLPARAIAGGEPVAAAAADMGSTFVDSLGSPSDGNATLLPLTVGGKVKALLYADGGDGRTLDSSALQLLVRSSAAWLELQSLRREVPAAAPDEAAEIHEEPAAAETLEEAPPEPEPAPVPEPTAPAADAAAADGAAPEAAPAPAPEAPLSDVHKKAKRFAKLLVDEIRLYNKEKVEQGRQSKDLYERLREDIEKSRATYDKRFGASEAASADYFSQELIRILAENDASLLGSGFQK